MAHRLRSPDTVQAVRPTRHWWRCPRVLAWFRVLMVGSLVKPPASVGPLSRIGDYLFAARGPGLFLRIRRRTTFPPKSAVTRGPPHPLFHRRSIRREGLDQVILRHERHLQRLLTSYLASYHRCRTHRSLAMDCPAPRSIQLPERGTVIAVPDIGRLHHRDERTAASPHARCTR